MTADPQVFPLLAAAQSPYGQLKRFADVLIAEESIECKAAVLERGVYLTRAQAQGGVIYRGTLPDIEFVVKVSRFGMSLNLRRILGDPDPEYSPVPILSSHQPFQHWRKMPYAEFVRWNPLDVRFPPASQFAEVVLFDDRRFAQNGNRSFVLCGRLASGEPLLTARYENIPSRAAFVTFGIDLLVGHQE